MKKRTTLWMLTAGLILSSGATAWAGEPTEKIRETTNKILEVVQAHRGDDDATVAKRRSLMREHVDRRFDWAAMAQRSLGRHWRGRSEEQRQEFLELFSRLLEDAYMNKVEGYSGEEVLYEDERRDDDYARVFVKIVTSKGENISVEYRLKAAADDWLVYDIVIEGVSLVKNYRSQFESLLASGSFEEMLDKIRDKVQD